MDQISYRRVRLSRVLRLFFIEFGVFLSIETALLLLVNPSHILGVGDILHHMFALVFLLTHGLLLPLMLLLELSFVFLLALGITKPLAVLAYLRDVQKARKDSYQFYFPLTGLPLITEDTSHQTPADLGLQNQEQRVSILDLVQRPDIHQLLIGVPGAGKTMVLSEYQYIASKRRWAILLGREKLPIYIPMKSYSLFLKTPQRASAPLPALVEEKALLSFLFTTRLPGMRRIQPYLKQLIEQGRVLFLCDGLNEVDSDCLTFVTAELSQLMHRTPVNRVVMTCREVDYHEQPQLRQLVDRNAVAQMLINPLGREQVEEFIEEYSKKSGMSLRHTKEEMTEMIDLSSLRTHCTNPMMLFTLIQIIDDIDIERGKQLDTRGRLMREFVSQLISRERQKPRWNNEPLKEQDVVLLLGEIACAARWASDRNAIQLPVYTARERLNRRARFQELADGLQSWLYEYPAHVPFTLQEETTSLTDFMSQHERFDRGTLANLVEFVWSANLIHISSSGELTFRHEMIAEYFVAEYFCAMDSIVYPPLPLHEELLTDVGRWSETVAIWAGLVEDPMELAKRFAALGKSNRAYILDAVTFSLICIGVLWTPSHFQTHRPVLPTIVEETLAGAVRNAGARAKLARIFDSCAQKGGREVYLSLLPLLTFPGVDELLVQLDKTTVPGLLFDHLEYIIEDITREDHVKCLMRVLGRFGAIAVAPATLLSQATPERSSRLRVAAIYILGGTNEQDAVEPLIACLSDTDSFISNCAAKALIRLGPEHALPQVIQALETRAPTSERRQVHQAVLLILERFLKETRAERQVTGLQYQRILQAIIPVLSSSYATEVQKKAREVLVGQARIAGESEGGKKAREALIRNLSTGDALMAGNIVQALKEVGTVATSSLLDQLPRALDSVRIRIVEVFESVRDLDALPHLLSLVADSSPMVQQRVASALRVYAPESIAGLIQQVVSNDNEVIAERSAKILEAIGEASVKPVMEALFPIMPGRTRLLVQVLEHIHDPQAIPRLIELLETSHKEPLLTVAVIHALGQYEDKRVVPPLLKILAHSNPQFYEEASHGLSHLREIALDGLVAALASEQEPATILRIQYVLYFMVPFPGEQLITKLADASDAQIQHIMNVFLMKKEEGATVLARYLHHPDDRVQDYVRQTLAKGEGRVTVPVMLALLNHPPSRTDSAEFLLKFPQDAIPQLVNLLSDDERGNPAREVLLQFGPRVIPFMLPGLDSPNDTAREYAKQIIVSLVLQKPEEITHAVQLLKPALPQRACEALFDVLTSELASISLPALLKGLETTELIKNVSAALKRLMLKNNGQSSEVLNGLLEALKKEKQHQGAKFALVGIGASAVDVVGNLILDDDDSLAQASHEILRDIGGPALPFIWKIYSDNDMSNHKRQKAALRIFHSMPTEEIKNKLVELLTSDKPWNTSMGLGLLLERVKGELAIPGTNQEIIPALLEHLQARNDELTSLRIIAWLLLLGGKTVADHIAQILQVYPNHQERLTRTFLLLGKEAEETLIKMLNQRSTPPKLKAEVAGMLGIMTEYQAVSDYAQAVSKYGYNTSNRIENKDELAISLRALGGLLAGGRWQISNLEKLRYRSANGSPERELYEILLGKLYTPIIEGLRNDLEVLKKDLRKEQDSRRAEQEEYNSKHLTLTERVSQLQAINDTLQESKRSLQASYEALQMSRDALQARNEALWVNNEALQSRNTQLELMLGLRNTWTP